MFSCAFHESKHLPATLLSLLHVHSQRIARNEKRKSLTRRCDSKYSLSEQSHDRSGQTLKFSTSKNISSDESSLLYVLPLHQDEEKRRGFGGERGFYTFGINDPVTHLLGESLSSHNICELWRSIPSYFIMLAKFHFAKY